MKIKFRYKQMIEFIIELALANFSIDVILVVWYDFPS